MRWVGRCGNLNNRWGDGNKEYGNYSGTLNIPQVSEFHFCLHCNKIITSSVGSHFQNGGLSSKEEFSGSSETVKSKEKSSTGSAYVSFSYCLACQFDSGHPKKRPYQHRLRIKSLDPK